MKVLFMCTANSCRSILSEAVFNHLAPAGFEAVSSGSFPRGEVLPKTLETLERAGIDTAGLYSKGNDAFQNDPPDVVITVCDKAAGEACPLYFGPAIRSHWGLADPSDVQGGTDEIEAAFDATLTIIESRCKALFALDATRLMPDDLKKALDQIGSNDEDRDER